MAVRVVIAAIDKVLACCADKLVCSCGERRIYAA